MSATRFVVVCFGRTGSSWLCSLLRSHPAILCHGELFNLKQIGFSPNPFKDSTIHTPWTMAARDGDPARFLAAVLSEDCVHPPLPAVISAGCITISSYGVTVIVADRFPAGITMESGSAT